MKHLPLFYVQKFIYFSKEGRETTVFIFNPFGGGSQHQNG